jgi:arylsulfatase A-like enzyme
VYFAAPRVIGRRDDAQRPDIVLVTLDTTRADALGAFGASPSCTPYFDALAQRSLVFSQAWSASNATTPSHASLFTGLTVQDHGVRDNLSRLASKNLTLAELLRERGYHTAAAVSVEHLQAGKSGLGQGFDQFLLAESDASRDGAITIRAVKQWLEDWRAQGDAPIFLWVHLFDAHVPYGPPAEFMERYCERFGLQLPPATIDPPTLPPSHYTRPGEFLHGVTNQAHAEFLYQAAVAYQDSLIENLMSVLAARGSAERTVLCLTADHGESLGEHQHLFNHLGLYTEVLRVPLILCVPGIEPERVDKLAWSLDVTTTLLELAGARVPVEMRGRNLVALARGGCGSTTPTDTRSAAATSSTT